MEKIQHSGKKKLKILFATKNERHKIETQIRKEVKLKQLKQLKQLRKGNFQKFRLHPELRTQNIVLCCSISHTGIF